MRYRIWDCRLACWNEWSTDDRATAEARFATICADLWRIEWPWRQSLYDGDQQIATSL